MIKAGMKVAILGFGISGRSAARYALMQGAEVLVSDQRAASAFSAEEQAILSDPRVCCETDGHSAAFLGKADLVLISPGVPPYSPILKELQKKGVPVLGELAVAAGKMNVPVVAVSGTNGKTTVTTLIGKLAEAAGMKTFVGGNIGTPLYEYLMAPAGYDLVVLEVSSFQLAWAGEFTPNIGVLLNVTPDHIDWHGSLENYRTAKMALFLHQSEQDLAITNGDDPLCLDLPAGYRGRHQLFGRRAGSAGWLSENKLIVDTEKLQGEFDLSASVLCDAIGNSNAGAAVLAAVELGLPAAAITETLQNFAMLPHRVQLVAEIDGVQYIDDSKATNTGAVLAALQQSSRNVILIAGGRDKGDDYRLLRDVVKGKVQGLILIGEAAGLIEQALGDLVMTYWCDSMGDAVRQAQAMARPGDAVLLSPACASFDMFRSYGHRGDVFQQEVMALQTKRQWNGNE